MKYILPVAILFITSCNLSDQNKSNTANKHMHKSSFEELVNRFEDSTRYKWQQPEVVIQKLGDLKGKKVADIGAGSGYFTFRLAEKGAIVSALDIDQRFVDYINSNKNSESVNAKLILDDDPKLDSSYFDVVLTVNTYHHIEERKNYFRKVWKGMKPGAELMVVDFKKEETAHGPPKKMRVEGLTVLRELQSAGFSKIVIDVTTLKEQYIVVAKKFDVIVD